MEENFRSNPFDKVFFLNTDRQNHPERQKFDSNIPIPHKFYYIYTYFLPIMLNSMWGNTTKVCSSAISIRLEIILGLSIFLSFWSPGALLSALLSLQNHRAHFTNCIVVEEMEVC